MLGVAAASADTSSTRTASSPTFTGYGFDTCSAPSLAKLDAWMAASPYEALGIYIGGVNRACKDGNLSASWVSSVVARGWNLMPLYVGLQAPCVKQDDLALIKAQTAQAQGKAAAADAVVRAGVFGIEPDSPIYFDMEGYATNNASCSKAVQSFVSGWVQELHARGYVAGVYGSAASTIRDLVPLTANPAVMPDAVWIANWNGQESVFGDPYVGDSYWVNHRRLHQYRGGHKETYGGVTINIDSNYLDGPVVGAGNVTPPPPPELPPGGSVTSNDGQATVSWSAGTFATPVTVTLTASTLASDVQGFAAGSYLLSLAASDDLAGGTPIGSFSSPLVIRVTSSDPALVPAYSSDLSTWTPLRQLGSPALPAGVSSGYLRESSGLIDISTTVAGTFGLLRDVESPVAPATLSGRFSRGTLLLSWKAAQDNSRSIARYEVTFGGRPLLEVTGAKKRASVRTFNPHSPSIFRVRAFDAAGNASTLSPLVKVVPTRKPSGLPRSIPAWAWRLFTWQSHGRKGARPKTPKPIPSWYWRWASWRLNPYRVAG